MMLTREFLGSGSRVKVFLCFMVSLVLLLTTWLRRTESDLSRAPTTEFLQNAAEEEVELIRSDEPPTSWPHQVKMWTLPKLNATLTRDLTNFKVCMALECFPYSGVTSKLVAVSMLHYVSVPLGFTWYIQNDLNDRFRAKTDPAQYSMVLNADRFYPDRCDYILGSYEQFCLARAVYFLMASYRVEMYDVLMFDLLRNSYRADLRRTADNVFEALQSLHRNTEFIGAQVRMEELGDKRVRRNVSIVDYRIMLERQREHVVSQDSHKKTMILMQGDKSIRLFAGWPGLIFIEDFILQTYPHFSSLAAQFIAMDISSRLRYRVTNRYSNTYPVMLGFHKLNGNTKNLRIADVFSMRILSYNETTLEDIGHPLFPPKFWEAYAIGPYIAKHHDTEHVEEYVHCWVNELNANPADRMVPTRSKPGHAFCYKKFNMTEVGKPRITQAPTDHV